MAAAANTVTFDSSDGLTQGTLTVQANGTWTFSAANNLDNDFLQQMSFTLSATDGDGDGASDSQTITINDGVGPTGTPQSVLFLQEADLDLVQDGADLVSGTATGSTPTEPEETDSGTLTFNAGSDDLVNFLFGSPVTIFAFAGAIQVPFTWSGEGTNQLVGSIDGIPAIYLSISGGPIAAGTTGSVTVTATLADNLPHYLPDLSGIIQISGILVQASDHDGESTVGAVGMLVFDDVPTANDDQHRDREQPGG